MVVKEPVEAAATLNVRGSIQHRVQDRLNEFE